MDSSGLQGNGESWNPAISGDGRFVAFDSLAPNLLPADTNSAKDVFVHDRTLFSGPAGGIAELPELPASSTPNHIALAALAAGGGAFSRYGRPVRQEAAG